ncbi:hypothetical protein [Streptomyces rubrogriseus]|uniref:hypothetical protein n=1 Tax=Streptomyces rubrogriseus TaxID=194673 RepID=UPI0037D04F27
MPTLIVVELERVGERVQDSVGRSYLATLLHPLATVPRVVSLGPGRLGRVIAWLGLLATQSAGYVD